MVNAISHHIHPRSMRVQQHGQRHNNDEIAQNNAITGAEGDFNGCKSGLKDKRGHSNLGRRFDSDPRLQNLSDLAYRDRKNGNRYRGRAT